MRGGWLPWAAWDGVASPLAAPPTHHEDLLGLGGLALHRQAHGAAAARHDGLRAGSGGAGAGVAARVGN
jgi:hypothetical protein